MRCRCRCCCCSGESNKEFEEIYESQQESLSALDGGDATTWNIAVYEDDDPAFTQLLLEADTAIDSGILPEMIIKGSSGSYFVKNVNRKNIGVFKPKDEEPYGTMNPKWAKWFQRKCCPCCFGRGCLVPNSGYLSEAGASLVDMKMGLNVVPKTKVIRMASSTFHYGKIKREKAKVKKSLAGRFPAVGKRFHRVGLPLKLGSFQMFVDGYKDASEWLQYFESHPLTVSDAYEFQVEFERMVILDYMIRNTDRGNDNWLIRYEAQGTFHSGQKSIPLNSYSPGAELENNQRRIKIAAIDNGLAFPFKHPDEWRAYPYHWAKLSYAKLPFSVGTRERFLPFLSNISFIEELCSDLYCLFSMDKNFQKHIFEKQMSVMRGQVLNLANALRDMKSPLELTQMKTMRIVRATDLPMVVPKHTSAQVNKTSSTARIIIKPMKISPANTLMFGDEYRPEFQNDGPVFTMW